jgi:hypothetical protein
MDRADLGWIVLFRLGDLSKAISQWISKAEQAERWASERAAIKAEVTQAKETVDLLRMARPITRSLRTFSRRTTGSRALHENIH